LQFISCWYWDVVYVNDVLLPGLENPENREYRSKIFLQFISYWYWDMVYVNDVLLPGLENPENPEYEYRIEKDIFAIHFLLEPGRGLSRMASSQAWRTRSINIG
jgi:hypothetical protein